MKRHGIGASLTGLAAMFALIGWSAAGVPQVQATTPGMAMATAAWGANQPIAQPALDLSSTCQAAVIRRVAASLPIGVSIARLPDNEQPGPFLTDGVKYVAASGDMPAHCRVTGSFVTNPKTGKTANFLATLPANWNQKYLQLGCGGHCGTFAVSDAASPTITITAQGKPGDSIRRGYASFATDEGHQGFSQGKWAITPSGAIDDDALEDFLYRAQKVMVDVGKSFTTAFYAQASGMTRPIRYSYFCGCSGGGRDALVAATFFPEAFDGIVSGSPYANMADLAFHSTGISMAAARSPAAQLTPALVARIDPIVKAMCDTTDGVKDGLIQNPAACDFRPERDLPRCKDDVAGDTCFIRAQAETVSTLVTAVTDERGRVVQPGYTVGEIQPILMAPPPTQDADPWLDTGNPATGGGGGIAALGDAVIRVFAHRNDPAFHTPSVIRHTSGGPGPITGFRVAVPASEVARVNAAVARGIGDRADAFATFVKLNRKLLIWSNSSDQLLSPYMATNLYNRMAKRFGGHARLQRNVRLFALPGTAHCSGAGPGEGPGSFDALQAIEQWVERGTAPNAIPATLYERGPIGADFTKPMGRTMPLCAYPTMARYRGKGDVREAANWSCPAGDASMLRVGESGRQAGVTS